MSVNANCDHKRTKKSMIKKSLNGFILLPISILYGNDASETHANNAPISSENPITSIPAANKRHQPIEKIRRNSCDFATYVTTRGRINFVIKYVAIQTAIIFPKSHPAKSNRST
jgi:hypothetical protein